MLGVVIRQVALPSFPVDCELSLTGAILDPVESHIHCFGSLHFDVVVGESFGCGVVGDNGGRLSLWMSHFFEDCPNVCGFLAVDK